MLLFLCHPMVLFGGQLSWFYPGGAMGGHSVFFSGYFYNVNERAVRILGQCILVGEISRLFFSVHELMFMLMDF